MALKKIFLRYGVFAILILMTIGLYFLLQTLSIRQKEQVQLFVTGPHTAVAYLPEGALYRDNTFAFSQGATSELRFRIDSIHHEPSQQCVYLTSSDSLLRQFGGNTFVSGYRYQGKKSLWKLVIEKMF